MDQQTKRLIKLVSSEEECIECKGKSFTLLVSEGRAKDFLYHRGYTRSVVSYCNNCGHVACHVAAEEAQSLLDYGFSLEEILGGCIRVTDDYSVVSEEEDPERNSAKIGDGSGSLPATFTVGPICGKCKLYEDGKCLLLKPFWTFGEQHTCWFCRQPKLVYRHGRRFTSI